jgi:hypothetical protein
MKKTMFAVVAALALALVTLPAHADSSPTKVVLNAELTVAAGAVINVPASGSLDMSKATQVIALVDNSAGAGARNFSWKCYAKDGTTVLYTGPTLAVSNVAPGQAMILFDARASSVTAATLQTLYPVRPCPRLSFHLAAAGAAAATVSVFGYGPATAR